MKKNINDIKVVLNYFFAYLEHLIFQQSLHIQTVNAVEKTVLAKYVCFYIILCSSSNTINPLARKNLETRKTM